ncbi:MAG: glycosyltransferase, partial [Bacteroidota bacterium]
LLVKLGLENKFVIGYIGTHGLAHKLDFILQCASVKGLSDSFHFLFIGDGAQKSNLLRLKDKLGLKNISMCDPVPKSEVYEYISILDVALVNLRKSDTFKTVIPSKIFENAAMQKPILLGVEGESKEIIASYQAGLCFEPENQTEFISAINKLKNDKDFYSECVEGCKKLANDFDRIALANKMSNVLIQYSKKTVSSSKITKV